MGKRGRRPQSKVEIKWSPNFAYAIGLLASDGCLSPDGRHIIFTSIDVEQLQNFLKALCIDAALGKGKDQSGKLRITRVQFGDVLFYRFLLSIGFTPNKSKTLGRLDIPRQYFFDFLRGSFDGDGSTYSYFDPRWKSSFMFYTSFVSASKPHIDWLREEIYKRLKIQGHISSSKTRGLLQLRYAKKDSLKLLREMYYADPVMHLSRKRLKIDVVLGKVGLSL